MASIYKRKYWIDPTTRKKVRKGTPGAEEVLSKFYTIIYTDAKGRSRRKRGYKELRPTEQLAARLEKNLALGAEGLVDPFAESKRKPLTEHLADFLEYQAGRGRDDKYRYNLEKRIGKIIEELGWDYFGDVDAAAFEAWMVEYRDREEVSGGTVNQFLDSIRAFINWGVDAKRKRFPSNPLADVEDLTHEPTFRRRSLTPEQIAALLNTCAAAGRDKVYRFALATGLRRQEIADLQWGDVVIDTPTPFLKLRSSATKARRADDVPLRADVAAELKTMRPEGWADGDTVFAAVPTVEEYRADLVAAGVEVPADKADRLDFHGLRTTLGSLLAKQGTAPRVAMEIMRHTDMRLTTKIYTDPRIFDTAGEVNRLPILPPAAEQESLRATGTDDQCAQNRHVNACRDTPPAAAIRRKDTGRKNEQTPVDTEVAPPDAASRRDTPDTEESSAGRIRTYKKRPEIPMNTQFCPEVGAKWACSFTSAGDGESRREAEGPEIVAEAWAGLPPAVRTTILSLVELHGGLR